MRIAMKVLGGCLGLLALSLSLTGCTQDLSSPGLGDPKPAKTETPVSADAPQWGTIKGQIVWGEKDLPAVVKLDVNKDNDVCLKKGPVVSEEFVVDGKTKGVKNVFVWLMDAKDPAKGKLPIHPSLAKSATPKVTLDQPCCAFEPHVIAVRDDQTLDVKNSASVPHNVHLLGGGMDMNKILSPGDTLPIGELKSTGKVVTVQCDIHRWMKGYIFIFSHPYYTVTGADGKFEIKNAPAGDYRIAIWQEGMGWVAYDNDDKPKDGKVIKIKADGETDLGTFKVTKPKE